MKYATLVVSKPNGFDKMRHTVIAHLTGEEPVVWSRLTNGKQGRGNAWQRIDLSALTSSVVNNFDTTYGQPVAVPVTERDIADFEATGTPSALFQKLLRNAPTTPSNIELPSLLHDLWNATPEVLAQYHADGRTTREPVMSTPSIGFVPSLSSMANYVERTFHGISETEIFDFALRSKMNVLIEGDAGTGKTSSSMTYAAKRGLRFYSVSSNMALEPTQLFGTYVPNAQGKFVWQDGGVTDIVRNGGVLLINEINFLPARVATVLFSLLDYRRQITLMDNGNEVINAHDDLLIVADMNPNYRGTSLLNEAFKDRFDMKLRYEYDLDIERKILKSDSLLDLAKRMRAASNGTSPLGVAPVSSAGLAFDTPISTRILKAFEKIATGLSYDVAVDVFINNFSDEERSSVRMLLDGMKFNLQSDLGLLDYELEAEEVENASTATV